MWKNGLIFFCLLPLFSPPPPLCLFSSFGLIQPCSLASAVAWCEIWETYVVFYFRKMISGIECVFLLAVKLWSCPVWFFDDGKEASKCFLSEFHIIKHKVWFLYFAPTPHPKSTVQCHLFCQKWEEVHIVHITITSLLLAHTCMKMATVSVLHKSHFKCSAVEDRGFAYCSQKGKGIHWGKVCLCCALEGPVFFVLEVRANNGPSALSTELHSSSHAKALA